MWACAFSPRLYKVYREGVREKLYQPTGFEKWGDKIITVISTLFNIGIYTSPFISLYIYKRGFFFDEARFLTRMISSIGCFLILSFIMRGYGRSRNPKYLEFMEALSCPDPDPKAYLLKLRRYDFQFNKWPVTYRVPKEISTPWWSKRPFMSSANLNLPMYKRLPLQILAYIATHTFGIRLIYPGMLSITQHLLGSVLLQGRTQLVETYNGQRTKLGTADGNDIDTMFVDQRTTSNKGQTLVICCEGNSGFYEIGIMSTPIKAGHSALGWNHPGFAGSTGMPYPEQEQFAIDAVMQYVLNELGFQPEDIILFGWSIGGYAASWAAVNYPQIKGLVLDATFDDLLPLAENHMPASWSLLVKEVVKSHVDLNIAQLVTEYPGPVHLVRRLEDEIICLKQRDLSTNRVNNLLLRLIHKRHPQYFKNEAGNITQNFNKFIALPECERIQFETNSDNVKDQQALRLISKYMQDFASTHCTPLPEIKFESAMYSITTGRAFRM